MDKINLSTICKSLEQALVDFDKTQKEQTPHAPRKSSQNPPPEAIEETFNKLKTLLSELSQ